MTWYRAFPDSSEPVICRGSHIAYEWCGGDDSMIAHLKYDAHDSDFPRVYLASADFANILTATLILNSGQATYWY
jgi:hypothetical protein